MASWFYSCLFTLCVYCCRRHWECFSNLPHLSFCCCCELGDLLKPGCSHSGPNFWLITLLISFMHLNMKLWGTWFPGGDIILGFVSTAVPLASSPRIPISNYAMQSGTIKWQAWGSYTVHKYLSHCFLRRFHICPSLRARSGQLPVAQMKMAILMWILIPENSCFANQLKLLATPKWISEKMK